MPVNFQEIQPQVRDFGAQAAVRHTRLENLRQIMIEQLKEFACQQTLLAAKVRRAVVLNPGLRCALPTPERLDAHFPVPDLSTQVTLLAADGSQIYPNRQDQVEFCVINVGILRMLMGGKIPPSPLTHTKLLEFNELYSPDGLITEDKVSMIRNLSERQMLAELAIQEDQPVITLTDGPLEIHYGRKETEEYTQLVDSYLETLKQLIQTGASAAGYIDKPDSDLVGRLLEIANLSEEDLPLAGKKRPYLGVTDRILFASILQNPGERSAIYCIQSLSNQKFKEELSLHFFYLNVGRVGHPHLARVEIPAWVADHGKMLDDLHASLVAQSEVLGTRRYPYILHRAHEVAVVTMEEKEQVENMIIHEYYRNGMNPEGISDKQGLKNQGRRKG